MKRPREVPVDYSAHHPSTRRALSVLRTRCEHELSIRRGMPNGYAWGASGDTGLIGVVLFDMAGVDVSDTTTPFEGPGGRLVVFRHVDGRGWCVLDAERRARMWDDASDVEWPLADVSPVAYIRNLVKHGAFVVYELGGWTLRYDGMITFRRIDYSTCRYDAKAVSAHEKIRGVYWPLKHFVARRVWAPDGKRAKAMLADLSGVPAAPAPV